MSPDSEVRVWYYDVTDSLGRWQWSGYAESPKAAKAKARAALKDAGKFDGRSLYARKVKP